MHVRNIFWASLLGTLFIGGILTWTMLDTRSGLVMIGLGVLLLPAPFLIATEGGSFARYPRRISGLALLVIFILCCLLLGDWTPAAAVVAAIPAGAVFSLSLILRSNRTVRRRRAMVVVAYLEQAVRANLPLTRMLQAAARSERGIVRARLKALNRELEQGASVSDALARGVPEMSARSLALIGAADRIGQLAQVLDQLMQEESERQPADALEGAFISIYPVMMSIGLFIIVSMIVIFVLPKFQQIFHDFKVQMPGPTIFMIATANNFAAYIFPLLIVGIVLYLAWMVWDRFWPWRKLMGGISPRWNRGRDLADVFGVIASTLRAGLGMDAAIRSAAELPVNARLRLKLYRWAGGIEQGLGTSEAARRAELPKLVTGLSATANSADCDEVFRFLQRYYESRFSRMRQLMRGAAVPAMVFFFAIIVGTVALALFLPLVNLTNSIGGKPVSL